MTVADSIVRFLHAQGVGQVFELVGGMITHLLDAIHRHGQLRIVSVHHEQAAAFAADACGRMSGVPGVALATSGPGATNLLTGIGSCYFDSSPAVFITGQVNRSEQKGDRPIRQLGFQETDIVAMAAPITKGAWRVRTPEEVPELLGRAFQLATAGRPGPVLIDIPLDVQRAEIEETPPRQPLAVEAWVDDPVAIEELLERATIAERPLILAGGGIRASGAIGPFRAFVEAVGIPVVHSLMAVDVLPFNHPLRVGMIGSYGNRWANLAIARSDLLIVLGSRLDVRQTGSDTESFRNGRVIYHVDCEPGELNNRVTGCRAIQADLHAFLEAANRMLNRADRTPATAAALSGSTIGATLQSRASLTQPGHPPQIGAGSIRDSMGPRSIRADRPAHLGSLRHGPHLARRLDRPAWLDEVREARRRWPDTSELPDVPGINPNRFLHELAARSGAASAFVADVGQHQMWAAQSLELGPDQRFLTSGGMGAMGFALPAAIGVAVVRPGRPVVVVAGDGGFQINLQELQTVVRNHLPIKIVILNNRCHGMVRQFQQSYFEERYQSTLWGYSAPDLARVADAYGIESWTISRPAEVPGALDRLWRDPEAPGLLEVMIDTLANAYPKLAFGRPISEMEPTAKPLDMEGT